MPQCHRHSRIFQAVLYGNTVITREILEDDDDGGAQLVNIMETHEKIETSLLYIACNCFLGGTPERRTQEEVMREREQGGNGNMVQLLLEFKADFTLPTSDGFTALHNATRNGEIESFDLLIKANANMNAKCKKGRTPMMMCILVDTSFHEDVLTRVISNLFALVNHGADINAVCRKGKSVLHYAAERGHPIVDFLLDNGADTELVDKHGKHAGQSARMQGHKEMADSIDTVREEVLCRKRAVESISNRVVNMMNEFSGDVNPPGNITPPHSVYDD